MYIFFILKFFLIILLYYSNLKNKNHTKKTKSYSIIYIKLDFFSNNPLLYHNLLFNFKKTETI